MKFVYTNYKGETEERDVDILSFDYISNPGFGYEPGWFLTGRDRGRNGDMRSFRIDPRMSPLGPAMHRHPGLTLCEYPITEGHEVRNTVEQIKDRVNEAIGEESQKHGLPPKNTEQPSTEIIALAAKIVALGENGLYDIINRADDQTAGKMLKDILAVAGLALTQRG